MQPTTLPNTDNFEQNPPKATFVTDNDPESLEQVTTAPQAQLKQLDEDNASRAAKLQCWKFMTSVRRPPRTEWITATS